MLYHKKSHRRRGNALVELVVCLPILFVLTFGGIEACNLNHLQQCATQASYQGALKGIAAHTTEAEIRSLLQALLSARGINHPVIAIEGPNGSSYDSLASGDKFRVSTTIPASTNLPMLSVVCRLSDLRSDRFAEKN